MQSFHSCLLRGYLAIQLKKQYLSEKELYGRASSDTTVAMILKIRRSISILAGLSKKRWREGIEVLKSEAIFFRSKPAEYTFSFCDYLSTRTFKEKLSFETYAYYYTYSLTGAKCFRFLMAFKRVLGINSELIKAYRNRKQRRIIKKGLSL